MSSSLLRPFFWGVVFIQGGGEVKTFFGGGSVIFFLILSPSVAQLSSAFHSCMFQRRRDSHFARKYFPKKFWSVIYFEFLPFKGINRSVKLTFYMIMMCFRDLNLVTYDLLSVLQDYVKSKAVPAKGLDGSKIWKCPDCEYKHKKNSNMFRHIQKIHTFFCYYCIEFYHTAQELSQHRNSVHVVL